MTLDLITLAREAMALEGAPRFHMPEALPHREGVWDLANTDPDGDALGGVLLGALGSHRKKLVMLPRTFRIWNMGSGYTFCPTLAEACCRVAVSLGRWPGGVE